MANLVTCMSFDTSVKTEIKIMCVVDQTSKLCMIFICVLIGRQDSCLKTKQTQGQLFNGYGWQIHVIAYQIWTCCFLGAHHCCNFHHELAQPVVKSGSIHVLPCTSIHTPVMLSQSLNKPLGFTLDSCHSLKISRAYLFCTLLTQKLHC